MNPTPRSYSPERTAAAVLAVLVLAFASEAFATLWVVLGNVGLEVWAARVLDMVLAIFIAAPLAYLYWHPYRGLGWVPVGLTVAAIASVPLAESRPPWAIWLFFGPSALATFCIWRYQITADRIPRPWWQRPSAIQLAFVIAVLVSLEATDWSLVPAFRAAIPWVATAAALLGLVLLFRPFFELLLEPPVWLSYHIRGAGPGVAAMPAGPCLLVVNHAAWIDPIFLGKVLPRPFTPMMTARFYQMWFLRPMLKYVYRVIVVPEVPLRREAPELAQALAALDAGRCVVIFPEGYLRRKEEVPLRRFGQGVWQLLAARPETPVVACWIEGSWGSYMSFAGGPPTKNKRPDVRRPIGVGVSAAEVVPADVLADQMRTRVYLMNRVLAARELHGLAALPMVELPEREKEPE